MWCCVGGVVCVWCVCMCRVFDVFVWRVVWRVCLSVVCVCLWCFCVFCVCVVGVYVVCVRVVCV